MKSDTADKICQHTAIPYNFHTEMSQYENDTVANLRIPRDHAFLVRIDTIGSNNFFRSLREFAKTQHDKPHSIEFSNALLHTAYDLIEHFNASSAYVGGGEIILFFPPISAKSSSQNDHVYCGRVARILSAIASATAVKFAKRIVEQFDESSCNIPSNEECNFVTSIASFSNGELSKMVKYIVWRGVGVLPISYKSLYSNYYFEKGAMTAMTESEKDEVLHLMGYTFDDLEDIIKYGLFIRGHKLFSIRNLEISLTLDPKDSSNLAKYLLAKKQTYGIKKIYDCHMHAIATDVENTD
jgi:tRNA(His) 5'-end guanylyltransferase